MSGDRREEHEGGRAGRRATVSGAQFAGLGVQFAATLLAGLFLGSFLDKRLGTGPVLTMAGMFLGAAGAFYSMYRKLIARQREVSRKPPGPPSHPGS